VLETLADGDLDDLDRAELLEDNIPRGSSAGELARISMTSSTASKPHATRSPGISGPRMTGI
jgi:hypothetical protein